VFDDLLAEIHIHPLLRVVPGLPGGH